MEKPTWHSYLLGCAWSEKGHRQQAGERYCGQVKESKGPYYTNCKIYLLNYNNSLFVFWTININYQQVWQLEESILDNLQWIWTCNTVTRSAGLSDRRGKEEGWIWQLLVSHFASSQCLKWSMQRERWMFLILNKNNNGQVMEKIHYQGWKTEETHCKFMQVQISSTIFLHFMHS